MNYKIGRDESGLTIREREVLAQIKQGKSNASIARDLGVSKQRVGQIVRSLVQKNAMFEVENGVYAAVVRDRSRK